MTYPKRMPAEAVYADGPGNNAPVVQAVAIDDIDLGVIEQDKG